MVSEAQGEVEGGYLAPHFGRAPRMAGFKVSNASYSAVLPPGADLVETLTQGSVYKDVHKSEIGGHH